VFKNTDGKLVIKLSVLNSVQRSVIWVI